MKMKIMLAGGVVFGAAVALAWARTQGGGGSLAPEVWVNAGDTDGDGLTDTFEGAYGLDPQKVDTFGDGIPDESRMAADGRTMWEVQEAGTQPSPGSSGGGCGATGMEGLLAIGLLRLARARKGNG